MSCNCGFNHLFDLLPSAVDRIVATYNLPPEEQKKIFIEAFGGSEEVKNQAEEIF